MRDDVNRSRSDQLSCGIADPSARGMKIILNFVPLKAGGGLQVGLDFIEQAKARGSHHEWHLVATETTPFAAIQPTRHVRIARLLPNSLTARLWFEYFGCRELVRRIQPDVIYTQFGPHWPGAKVPNVVGCAYSNLLYPEIDFWGNWPLAKRIVKKVIDLGRRKRMLAADALIFETEDLRERAVRLYARDTETVFCVRPSVSSLVTSPSRPGEATERHFDLPPGLRVLLLSRYHPNKNFDLLPKIARELKDRHVVTDVCFVLTLPPDAATTLAIMNDARALGVADKIVNVGPVAPDRCKDLYRACSAAILPSRLESFSNNIAEAWAMERPLLVSELDWAISLCGDGAAYFRYNDAVDAARCIVNLKDDEAMRAQLVEQGAKMLRTYPTSEQRFDHYLRIIESFSSHKDGVSSPAMIEYVP